MCKYPLRIPSRYFACELPNFTLFERDYAAPRGRSVLFETAVVLV